ncbi:MAG: HAD-IA family hydrolase [Acidobacteria bacterium]|nr:HAD-IA family hydrolase [Acidobacteriota bacterium]
MSNLYRWIFFDLFDTLCAVNEPVYYEGKRRAAEAAGLSYEVFMKAWKATGPQASVGQIRDPYARAKAALESCGISDRAKIAIVAELDVETIRQCVFFYEGAREALASIRQAGFKLGLISNATATTAFIVQPLGLREKLDLLVFSYEAKAVKPDRAIFDLALRRSGCQAGEALFVGDGANHELDGARDAGFATLCMDHPVKAESFRDRDGLSGPDHKTVHSFAELLALPEIQQPAGTMEDVRRKT